MHLFSTLKWTGIALCSPFIVYSQSCMDYSEATLTGDTVCLGNVATVRVHNTIQGKPYQAYSGTKAVGSPVISTVTGSTVELTLPSTDLIGGAQTIGLRPTNLVCSSLPGGEASVLVNVPIDPAVEVIGDTICTNSDVTSVTIRRSQMGVVYQTYLGPMIIGVSVPGNGTDLVLVFPSSSLTLGNNTITIRATSVGCGTIDLIKTANLRVNPLPSINLSLTVNHSIVCEKGLDVTLRINGVSTGAIYHLYYENVLWQTKTGKQGDSYLEFIVPNDSLRVGMNSLTVKAVIGSECGLTMIQSSVSVRVNPIPGFPFELKEDTLVVSADDTLVPVIFNWRAEGIGCKLEHIGSNNKVLLVPRLSSDTLGIPRSFFSADTNRIKVTTEAYGCGIQPYADTLLIIVKPGVITAFDKTEVSLVNQIGPNPFSTTLRIGLAKTGHYHLRVTSSVGTLIHEQALNSSETTLSTPWPSGAYYLEIEGEGSKERRKLIK